MREKEYSEWISKQGFDLLRHANCCKIAFNGGWESRQTEVDELQKRVDRSLKIINDIQKNGLIWSQYSMGDLEQALKVGET